MDKGSREKEFLLNGDSLDDTTSKGDYQLTAVPPSSNSHASEPTKVYRRRWYILAVFSTMVFSAGFYYNTFSPIQKPVKLMFQWEDWNMLLLNALNLFSLLFGTPLITWLAVSKGLRPTILLTAGLLFFGKALQILPYIDKIVDTFLMNVGMLISSLAAPVCIQVPAFLSSNWFPTNERTTATAIGVMSSIAGSAAGFVVGPAFVPYSTAQMYNRSVINDSVVRLGQLRSQFKELMYFQAALGLVVLVAVLAYFPNKPPLPPTISATEEHHHQNWDFTLRVRHLLRNRSFWLLAILYAVEFGIGNWWLLVLDLVLSKFGISEETASLLGCGAALGGIVSSLFISRIADYYNRSTKTILLLLFVSSTLLATIFSLTCQGIIHYAKPLLYVTCISSYMLTAATAPLLLEQAVECTYPEPEMLSTSFMSLTSSVVSLVCNIVFIFPNMDVRWINWLYAGSIAICVPGLLIYQAKYTRLDIDTGK